MSYIVTDCFHWIGFHIVNHLVEQGNKVVGFDDISTDKKENLSMFLGRNDLFSLNPNKLNDEQSYDTTIFVADFKPNQTIQSKRTIKLSNENSKNKTCDITIKLPLLFGEWMEMNDEGFYHNNKFIRFDSNLFLTEAIYIEDFIKSIMQSMRSTNLPDYFEVKPSGSKGRDVVELEKSIYIRDNTPIEDNLKTVQTHFKKFRNFY